MPMEPISTDPPRDIAQLKCLIASHALKFSGPARRIVETGFRHPDIIAFGSAASIATCCGVGPSSVLRLSKGLGFTSLRDFRQLFRNHLVFTRDLRVPRGE